jgi:hypothetical protein
MENWYTVTYGAPIKEYAQTTLSMDGISQFFHTKLLVFYGKDEKKTKTIIFFLQFMIFSN